jgi:hypothetical protein
MYAFINESVPGDLLFKTLMCKLELPTGLTPFWEVHPFEACKLCVNVPYLLYQYMIDTL